MNHSSILKLALCAVLSLTMTAAPLRAQTTSSAKPAAEPIAAKTPWGTPTLTDWNSVWSSYRGPEVKSSRVPLPVPTPEYAPYLAATKKALADGKEIAHGAKCLPPGVPTGDGFAYPVEIIMRPHQVTFLYEDSGYRRIRMNSQHPDYIEPSFVGDGVAHWEGDTLVIDTVAITTKTVIGGGSGGARHSNQLHLIQRMREVKPGIIEMRHWMEDPRAFTKPVEWVTALKKTPDEQINEHVCEATTREVDPNIAYDAFDHIPEPEQTEVHWAKPKTK